MIVEKESKIVGKVKFEKGRLSLAFPKTRVSQLDIQEQLDTFKTTGSLDFVNQDFTFRVRKEGETFNVSLTHPVTKNVIVTEKDVTKIEEMLFDVSTKCTGISLGESHSSTQLLSSP